MRKLRVKRFYALAAAALCILMLAGCAASALNRPVSTDDAAKVTVSGSCDISISGGVVTVSGAIDVMDGAWVDVSVVAQNGMVLEHRAVQKSQAPIAEQFTLTDEALSGAVDLKGYICFAPSYYHKQTKEVYEKYGSKFQNIANTQDVVWNNEGVIVTLASEWLYGVVPAPTQAPTPTPTPTPTPAPSAS